MKDTNETVSFLYDARGRLEYRMLSMPFRLSPNMKFIYDWHGRVSEYITNTDEFTVGLPFFEWHYLYYDNKGRIAKDTFFGDGIIGPHGQVFDPHMPENYTRGSKVFEYDEKNRIVREIVKGPPFGEGGEAVYSYTYDERGNLLSPGVESSAYDNKSNFNRTDPLLQFINRDYSLNNQRTAAMYNSYRLPLQYPFDGSFTIIDWLSYFDLKIKYQCK